jgi:hypothetical protein
MEFVLHNVLPGVAGLLLLALGLLWRRFDALRAQHETNQDFIRSYARKAVLDRNGRLRIPLDSAALMFDLEEPPRQFDARIGKQHRHPATTAPRRKKRSEL